MNRRDFLKNIVAVTASGAVGLSPSGFLSLGAKASSDPITITGGAFAPSNSDIVIEESEILPNASLCGYTYRAIAYARENPDEKKYFATFVDNKEDTRSKEFVLEMYRELSKSFQNKVAA